MGSLCCCGPQLDENTKMINDRLAAEDKAQRKVNKLLFLGPGGSGKTTVFKQLQWLHAGGFSKSDAMMLREHIYCQITQQMKDAIDHYYPSSASLNSNDQKLQSAISVIRNHGDVTILNEALANSVQYVWLNDKKIKNAFRDMQAGQNDKYSLDETTEYFWNDIDRIKDDQYLPTTQDIINVRYRTTGTVTFCIHFALYMCTNCIHRCH